MAIPKNGRHRRLVDRAGQPGHAADDVLQRAAAAARREAQLTIINPRSKLRSRVVGQGEPKKLQPYFGTTPQFPLAQSIRVHKGWVVALTVPTWAPALAVGLGARHVVAREPRTRQVRGHLGADAQLTVNQLAQYFCLYRTARLTTRRR